MILKAGKKAPMFSLEDKDSVVHTLKDISSKYVVLYFYPKDDTPGCTIEAIDFTKEILKLKKLGVSVIGISGGDTATKKKFCSKHKLKVTLLSDSDFSVCKKYGVYGLKKFMGNEYMGIFRTTFVLDKNKKIIKVFENVNPVGHVKEVIAYLKDV